MKLAITTLLFCLTMTTSQAKMTMTQSALDSHKRSASTIQTQTKNVAAFAVPRAQRRLLVQRELTGHDDGPPGPDELDLQSLYARPRMREFHPADDSEELSEYITVRLAVARAKAMAAYREKWS